MTDEATALGALEAEADTLLSQCFVHSSAGESVMAFGSRAGIAVGQKGAGKSAIYLMGRGRYSRVPTARLSPSTHQVEVMSSAPTYRHTATLLGYELRVEILRELRKRADAGDGTMPAPVAKKVKSALDETLKGLGEKLDQIDSISIDTPVFGFGLSRSEKVRKPLQVIARNELPSLDSTLTEIADAGVRCLLLIDDPEQILASSKALQPDLLGALLLAASMLNETLGASFKVVVLLKTHVFRALRRDFEDYDKLRQNFVMLRWTPEELDELLTKRMEVAVGGDSTDESSGNGWAALATKVGGRQSASMVRKFILDRLINGPRDLIWFAELVLDEIRRGRKGKDALEAAEARYADDHVDALQREYGKYGYKDVDSVVRRLFRPGASKDEASESPLFGGAPPEAYRVWADQRLLDEDLVLFRGQLEWLEALIGRTLCQLLYDVGVLGYRTSNKGAYVLPFEVGSDREDFDGATEWRVNPGFVRALGIG
jgi:hypothetical protein